MRASVCASSVLPEPVGPISRMFDFAEDFACAAIFGCQHLRGETDRGGASARGDDFLKAGERTTADEENVRGVDLQELLLRMLAAALRRHGGDGAFHDLQ